jgi:hypothetical protein
MGIPLTIQTEDDERLLLLKKQTKAKSKVDVIRKALTLLELQVTKKERIKKWKKSANLITDSSSDVLSDFNTPERFSDLP